MRWRIRSQLLVPLLTLLLGVVGISTWTALASAQHARARLETQMRDIARTVNEVTIPPNRQTLRLMRGLSGTELLLEKETGEVVTTFHGPVAVEQLPESSEDGEALRLGPAVHIQGETYLCNGVRLRHGVLYIFYPESLWSDALWAAVRPSLILGIFGGLASILLAVGVAQRLSRRIQELERRTRLIAAGDYSPMPLPRRDDEIRDLVRSINEMAQQIARLQETVQKTERLRLLGQVSGGLAHQLRNGVTGARLAVQLHARECAGTVDPEALDVALRQLALVEANLKRFLDLGRAQPELREPCSLTTLIDQAVALLRPQCRHAHTELTWQPSDAEVSILGDAGQLGHLFLNVIGNAVEAAGPGGQVRVGLRLDPKSAVGTRHSAIIEVWDSGSGPAPAVAERLFEPFVTGKPEGVGLGLAVARQVVDGHGGRIAWRREAGQTCFVIELPVETACGFEAVSEPS
jgi:signal transduction histidine kinase